MATFQLTVQQVILPSDDLSIESSSVDSFGSVVDPNVDFHLMDKTKECGINIAVLSDFSEEWKSAMKGTSVCSEQVPTSSISPMQTRKEDSVPLLTHNSHINSIELTVNDTENADNYGTLGTSYPIIPMAVAQYLNKHKPELCSEAEKYFSTKNYRSTNENTTSLPVIEFGTSPTSPLRSMSSTSDALALQHSVIGNPGVVPVSAEIVAQVVADTRLRLQQPSSKGSSRSSLHSFSSLQHELNDENNSVKDDNRSEPSKTKLIRYPNEYITSTTEKKSWLAYVTPENNISSVPKMMFESLSDHKQTASMRSCINNVGPMINLKTEMPIVHTPVHRKFYKRDNACGNSGEGSSVSSQENTIFSTNDCETESSFSEKFEIESACSEAFETESNISEISGIDDEMFQIRKLLIDVPLMSDYPFSEDCSNINGSSSSCKDLKHSGTQVCADMCNATTSPIKPLIKTSHDERSTCVDQSTETNDFQLFEVIREKANLEGQFENITKERNNLMSENIHLQSLTNSLQTQLNLYVNQSELILNEKQNILKELQFQGKEHKKWDSVIKEYQDIIDTKNSEIKALKEDLSESEQKNSQLRINFEELKVDLESKDGGISGLKKKIAELHVELQVHLQEKIQLKNEVKNVRSEMSMLQKSKEWYQDQLHVTQENRNILHQKLITIQGCEVTVSNNLEKIKSENNCLKQQLAEIQHRAVNEKEVLMKHLEIIQEDLKERESLFEEIQRDKGAAEEALIERARKVDEERSKLTNLTFMVSDLEHQMSIAKFNASEKEVLVSDLEKQKAELTKQIAVLQKSTNDKDLSIQKLTQDFKDLNTKMKHMEAVLLSSETLISTLKDEKTACDVALASANAEKHIIDEALRTLKGNLNRIENNFRQMKTDFVTKSSQVEQLLKEKNHLEESLRKSEEFLLHQQKDFETISISGNKDVELKFGDLEKEKGYLENILDVYSKDLQYCHHTIAELKKENEDLKNEFAKLKLNAKCTEEEVELLNSENMTLHEKISVVNKTVSLQNLVNHSSAVAQDSINSGNLLKQTEFENILIKLKKEQREKQRIFESNIKLLTRKLKEKMKDCKNAQNELKKLKEDSSNQMQLQSDASNNSGSFDCLQCKKLADVHKTCENLEEELKVANSTIQEQKKVVENSEEVIINLEKEIGRTKSISESNNALKLEITQLESHLGEKGRIISELTYKIRELDQKLNDDNSNNQSKIITLEEEINKDKSLIKGLRHQVFQEKRENSQIFRQLGTLKLGLERANQTADSRKQKISSLQAELSLKLESELKHKAQIQQLQTEIRIHQNEIEKLAKEMEEVKARDPALAEQMNSLSWHLKEKSNEVAALQKKHDLMECRHSSELQNLQNTIQSLQSEIEKLKNELVETRKDKFCYQAKVTELRKALKLRLNKQKAAEKQKDKKTEQDSQPVLGLDIPDPQVSFDESYIKSLLERSLQLPDNRPLNHLQECVNSLKQEMAELQKQLSSNIENSL